MTSKRKGLLSNYNMHSDAARHFAIAHLFRRQIVAFEPAWRFGYLACTHPNLRGKHSWVSIAITHATYIDDRDRVLFWQNPRKLDFLIVVTMNFDPPDFYSPGPPPGPMEIYTLPAAFLTKHMRVKGDLRWVSLDTPDLMKYSGSAGIERVAKKLGIDCPTISGELKRRPRRVRAAS